MTLKVKKMHPGVKLPVRKHPGDAGLDLFVDSVELVGNDVIFNTGLKMEIPEGYVGLLFPRSSVHETGLRMPNSVGVIDSGYRGEVKARFSLVYGKQTEEYLDLDSLDRMEVDCFGYSDENIYTVGERCAQLVIVPVLCLEVEEVETLSPSVRGTGGFGSTGRT